MRRDAATLADLRREFSLLGWDRKATGRILVELFLNLGLALGGIALFVASDNLLVCCCAMIVSTAGSIGVGTNTHTSSHYATSDRRWINELLTYLGYPVFLGLSATHWWRQHVVLHHPSPNVVGIDEDVDLAPWFARTRMEIDRSSGLLAFYYRHLQWMVFPTAIGLIGFNMQLSGWRSLIRALWNRQPGRRRHLLDLAALLVHYLVWIEIPALFFPLDDVLAFYALRIGLMGYAMFAVLAPGHFPSDALCLAEGTKTHDFLWLQTAATINFRTGALGRLICSGLQYQIEHHLFPNYSHVYYPLISERVRELCRDHQLPYRCFSWSEAIWKSLMALRHPPAVLRAADLAGIPHREISTR